MDMETLHCSQHFNRRVTKGLREFQHEKKEGYNKKRTREKKCHQ